MGLPNEEAAQAEGTVGGSRDDLTSVGINT